MWSFDLINDAISTAKASVEKSIDSALGIQGSDNGTGGQSAESFPRKGEAEDTGWSSSGRSTAQEQNSQGSLPGAVHGTSNTTNGSSAVESQPAAVEQGPGGLPPQPPKKKVVKKVIKRVVKQPSTDASAAKAETTTPTAQPVGTAVGQPDAEPSEAQVETVSVASTQLSTALQDGPFDPDLHSCSSHAVLKQSIGTSDAPGTSQQGVHASENGHHHDSPSEQWDAGGQHGSGWAHNSQAPTGTPGSQAAAGTAGRASRDASPSPHDRKLETRTSIGSTASGTQPPSPRAQHAQHNDGQEAVLQQPPQLVQPQVGEAGSSGALSSPAPAGVSPGSQNQSDSGAVLQQQLASISIPADAAQLSQPELLALLQQLQEGVAARDQALQHHAHKHHQLKEVVSALQSKNEELALKSARISEQDWEEMRKEFEQRLAAAERKVYALTKERDALKRGTEKLSDYGALLKEKDGIIKQVMEEGERLSAKQGEMEGSIKKLRAQIRDLEAERDKLGSKLSSEEATSEGLRRAKAQLERDLAAAQEAAAAELAAAKQHADSLLAKARADQAEAEERAREAASAGLQRKLRESESRCEAFSETVVELREALERQRQAADLREEMLKQDLLDLERRCQAAELRHQELAAKLPDATRPLLRQIEAMQSAANAQADAWAAAEQSLTSRIQDAEARAAAAGERERHATERAQVLQARLVGLEAALSTARAELKSLTEALDQAGQAQAVLREQLAEGQQCLALEEEHGRLLKQQLQQVEDKASQSIATEHAARIAAEADAATLQREFERRLQELEAQLAEARSAGFMGEASRGGGPQPPAMAAPGYRWMLVKEGDNPPAGTSSTSRAADAAGGDAAASGAALPKNASHSELASELLSSLVPQRSTGSSLPLASELEGMRAALRIKSGEVASLEAQVRALELTRDRLSEELVAAAQKAEEAAGAISDMEDLRKELQELQTRYVAAVELLGERDESLEELRADLMDVKNLYREQIEFMLSNLTPHSGIAMLPQMPQ